MKFKNLITFIVSLILLSTTAFTYSVPSNTIVYVAPTGEKYHREACTYTGYVQSMTIAIAEQIGYTPCSRCDPDVLTGKYYSNWDGISGSLSDGSSNSNRTSTTVAMERPWYDTPFIAILYVAGLSLILKTVLAIQGYFKRRAFEKGQTRLKEEAERAEREQVVSKFSNRTRSEIAQSCGMPSYLYIDEEDLPHDKCPNDLPDRYTVYIASHGTVYHSKPRCGQRYLSAVNITRVPGRSPCKICHAPRFNLEWYNDYIKVRNLMKKHGVDPLP